VNVAVCAYGAGNVRSVVVAFERLGASAQVTEDPSAVTTADLAVLPGVGSAASAMDGLRRRGLDKALRERVADRGPTLGICLGLQLLFERSAEQGGADGLGVLPGEVTALDAGGLKVPHIGWEPVRWERSSELMEGLDTQTPFYFVHSFAVRPDNPADVLGTAEWGERFACAVVRPPLYGVQFHPEKSGTAGLRLLANFARIVRAGDQVALQSSGPASG